MNAKEETELRALYRSWPNERLARAATRERADYRPEAIELMRQELEQRGISPEAAVGIVAALPPPPVQPPERGTRFLPARLTRLQYFKRGLALLGSLIAICVLGGMILPNNSDVFVVFAVIGVIYRILGLDIPRIKDAGLHPAFLLLNLVPLAGFVIQLILFFKPSRDAAVH